MPTESLAISAPAASEPTPRYRYRLRFAKFGDLRLVSHHDLMHVLERMMRRAEIPFAVSQGFHPQPKMSFALSLALGVIGRNEVFDVELTHELEIDELRERLNRVAPAGLSFSHGQTLDKKPSSQVRRMFYRLSPLAPLEPLARDEASPLPPGSSPILDLSQRIETFLALAEHWILRTRPQRRRLNIRPFVDSLTADSTSLSMTLWVAPQGSARPEEIVAALGLGRLLEEGAVFERVHLELLGEQPEHERFVPDLAAAAVAAPASQNQNDAESDDEPRRAPMPTSLIANPLSFDS
ncbi:MAG: TIGR03936 family radical SAM-associated protein [Planctomycetota bacterium]|jgi:radical SAM-linked protein